MLRSIMKVDRCSWDDAHEKLIEIDKFNEEHYWLYTMPYRIGIAVGLLCVFGSGLMVFQGDTALWYAREVVGEDLPEGVSSVKDMSTNQIGTWTWSWMEPMIGVASFILLCLQFSRAQSIKLNWNPYTEQMMRVRATRAQRKYPQYDPAILNSWCRHMPSVDWKFMPTYRREMYTKENRVKNLRGGV